MKIIFLSITAITILIFGSYFISDSFAIDYRDSSGYTPSWAKGVGYHSVLNECGSLAGDYSSDGNWCMEWMAYVLDQGVENFAESTESTSSSSSYNLSERTCTENKICAFPGDFIKYKNWDTFDNFEEIAIVEFKEKINDNTIKVFVDGFGSKPLTYILDLRTGIETNAQYGVDRPFNLLEPIPMKIGQEVNRYMKGVSGTPIEAEQTANLKDVGLPMNIERTIMAAGIDLGNGDVEMFGYDKKTGLLITQMEKYTWEGKQHTSGIALIDTNIFSVPTTVTPTKITSTPKTIESTSITTSTPKSKVTIVPTPGSGSIGCEKTTNGCFLPKVVSVEVGGVIIMENNDSIAHTFTSGKPTEGPSGIFDTSLLMAGNSFEYTPDSEGKIPYFCMVHPWMVGEIIVTEIPTTSQSETKQTTEEKVEIIQSVKPEPKVETSKIDDDNTVRNIALGAFVVLGIPAIIIALIIWKIKKRKKKSEERNFKEWKQGT